ncbi:hypothetical protein GCM10010840_34520 [Deinococcus aerolatus]|uniref:HNH endonuclease n=1 Tax=Deinococcus aerolatus TaxID=522487 RepID=A0ABQ2GF96_9DEIO|nr:HNH endonuclease [Deinococcus aerolatus]GGL93641.1 hypothetical protein GCM10010840_34520 [Deinococcus aerolatus]
MRERKGDWKIRDKATGKARSLHRVLAEQLPAWLLAPGAIVHHRDGTNNDPGNLLVLPNQRSHAHIESHLRSANHGMPSLFPELFRDVTEDRRGMLFEGVIP